MALTRAVPVGTTSLNVTVALRDSTTGQLKTGLVFGGITYSYWRDGASAGATGTAITTTKGVWASAGFVETDYAGLYQFGIPNACLAANSAGCKIKLSAADTIDAVIDIQLLSATRGLAGTALPDAVAGANTGLPVLDASLAVEANVTQQKGVTLPTPAADGHPYVRAVRPAFQVTGTLAPDVTGVYLPYSYLNGVEIYQHADGHTLWFDDTNWIIEAYPSNEMWQRGSAGKTNIEGEYAPGAGTGTATVARVAAPASVTYEQWSEQCERIAVREYAQAAGESLANVLEDTGTTLPATLTILQRSLILNSTTIDTLASQTSFTLTVGSTDDDAYRGCLCVVRDSETATQRCIGRVSAYTGATKAVTLSADPGVFKIGAGDLVDILPAIYPYQIMPASSRVTASGRVEGEPLEAWQHCDGSWTIAVFDDDDEPIDLTGKNLCFQAFSPDDRSTAVLTLKNYNSDTDITVGGDDGNEATVAYLAADLPDPELYYWLLRDMDTNDKTALGTSKLTVHEAPAAPAVT